MLQGSFDEITVQDFPTVDIRYLHITRTSGLMKILGKSYSGLNLVADELG
jgi:hypothetical protein